MPKTRHLQPAVCDDTPDKLVLLDADLTTIVRAYWGCRSFFTIETGGRRFKLMGRDRATSELIYVPQDIELKESFGS